MKNFVVESFNNGRRSDYHRDGQRVYQQSAACYTKEHIDQQCPQNHLRKVQFQGHGPEPFCKSRYAIPGELIQYEHHSQYHRNACEVEDTLKWFV